MSFARTAFRSRSVTPYAVVIVSILARRVSQGLSVPPPDRAARHSEFWGMIRNDSFCDGAALPPVHASPARVLIGRPDGLWSISEESPPTGRLLRFRVKTTSRSVDTFLRRFP